MIPMDAVLIEQVVTNLLENVALHATGATLIRLSVTREGDNAVFEVRDDGCGIAPEALPHIFDGYLSSKNEDTVDSKKSMGIGLSVCYTIVRAHGGVMTAHNSEEGGAVFRFTLPLEKERYEQ
ncbi:MAG: ATP-binding protein [Oscillospiraceae bacterium]